MGRLCTDKVLERLHLKTKIIFWAGTDHDIKG